ncbi:hypothetical protein AB0J52_26350, partial [Spirillospora sp. NPDC049652]
LRRRLAHLSAAGAALLAASAVLTVVYQLTPASHRPYMDGTTNNSPLSMVVGYNGLDRFGVMVPGTLRAAGTPGNGPANQSKGNGPSTQSKGNGPAPPDAVPPPPPGGTGGSSQGGTSQGGTSEGGNPHGGDGQAGNAQGGSSQGGDGQGGNAQGGSAQGGDGKGGNAQGGASERTGGWFKLFSTDNATQVGWLYPLAALALILGFGWRRRAGRTDRVRGGYLMWGVWFATSAVVFSKMDISHKAYLATLSIAVAALAGAGLVEVGRAFLAGGRRALALPLLVVAELAWTVYLSRDHMDFLPWLIPLVTVVGAVALAAMAVVLARRAALRRLAVATLAAGIAAILLTPTAWAASVLDVRYAGDSFEAGAGPTNVHEPGRPYALTADERALLAYTRAHRNGAAYLFATTSFDTASPYITVADAKVLVIGGFRSSVPAPPLSRIKSLAAAGKLRFVVVGGSADMGYSGTPVTPVIDETMRWARSACVPVPPARYGGTGTSGEYLYDCAHG